MKLEFKPEDFPLLDEVSGPLYATEKANALLPALKKAWLAELLKDAPRVYSVLRVQHLVQHCWTEHKCSADTHTALLVELKEIG